MEKLIEMTMDGRLSLVWLAVGFLVLAVVVEGVLSRRRSNRRVPESQRQGKY